MSGKVSGWVWDQDLPREEKYILLAYADHADHDGENIFPSVGLIAKKTGYSKRHVQRINLKLKNRGLLIEIADDRYKTKLYKIPINAWGDTMSSPTGTGDSHVTPPVTPESSPPDSHVTPGVTPVSPEPSSKSSKKTTEETSADSLSYDQTPWVMALADIQSSHYSKNRAQWEASPWASTWVVGSANGKINPLVVIGCQSDDDALWLTDRGSSIAEHTMIGVLGSPHEVAFVGPTALAEMQSVE